MIPKGLLVMAAIYLVLTDRQIYAIFINASQSNEIPVTCPEGWGFEPKPDRCIRTVQGSDQGWNGLATECSRNLGPKYTASLVTITDDAYNQLLCDKLVSATGSRHFIGLRYHSNNKEWKWPTPNNQYTKWSANQPDLESDQHCTVMSSSEGCKWSTVSCDLALAGVCEITNLNPCQHNNGGCGKDKKCSLTTPVSRRCVCPNGFHMKGSKCVDIDECKQNNGDCVDSCTNSVGSFHCECQGQGYMPSRRNKHICADIDECVESNGGCEHYCVNSQGGFQCKCKSGYTLWETKRCKYTYNALKNATTNALIAGVVALTGVFLFYIFWWKKKIQEDAAAIRRSQYSRAASRKTGLGSQGTILKNQTISATNSVVSFELDPMISPVQQPVQPPDNRVRTGRHYSTEL